MQLSVFMAGCDVSHLALLDQLEIVRDSTDAISTATVVLRADWYSLAKYGVAVYGTDHYTFRPVEWQSVEIKDQDDVKQFAGFVKQMERTAPEGTSSTQIVCTCVDFGILLDRITVNLTWPAGWSDHSIIMNALSGVSGITVTSGNIATLVSDLGGLEAKDITLRELLENICELTGGEWRVDYDGNLKYYTAGTVTAPFGVSDTPNNTTTFPHQMQSVKRDFDNAANYVTVLGGLDEITGLEISSTRQNSESQNKYGILSATVVDRGITSQAIADMRADAEISQRAFPRFSGTFTTWTDGLDVGQTVTVKNTPYAINGSYVIRTVRITQVNQTNDGTDVAGQVYCVYEVEFGQRIPDLISSLRRALKKPKQPTYTPRAILAGPISPDNFASTIAPTYIVNAKPVGAEWNAYSDNAIFLLTTDRKLYRRTGNDWTRSIVAADIIDELQAGQFAADSVTAGVIAAAAIRATDAVFELAAIKKADIDLVSADRLVVGSANIENLAVTDAKINSLSASKLTAGTIDATIATIINLNATNITVGQMSGTRLADGTVADVKIASLSASKLTAGTITASISISSPTITGGTLTISSGTKTVNINGTDLVKVQDSSSVTYTQMNGSSISVLSVGGGASASLTTTGLAFSTASYTSIGVAIGANLVVGSRRTGWTRPTGTASRIGYSTSTATLTQVAETLKALIDDLHSASGHGLIG